MTSPYPARRRRAIRLLGARPQSEEILGFLIALMEIQDSVFQTVGAWRNPDGPPGGEQPVEPFLRKFISDVIPVATPVLADAGQALAEADSAALNELLTVQMVKMGPGGRGDPTRLGSDDLAGRLGVAEPAVLFYSRAFCQPLAEVGFGGAPAPPDDYRGRTCPHCSHLPIVSVLRDEPDNLGGRHLVCSFCATTWPFPRLTCVHCEETSSDALFHHVSDNDPHIRVDECRTCGVYLKGVDLRKAGNAVPYVDEIAAVELDVWAQGQGLKKLTTNILGL